MKHSRKIGLQLGICFLMLMACGLHGCDNMIEHSEPYKRARETKAMSMLKKYQTAACIYQMELGRYGSLPELYEDRAISGVISDAFFNAWDGHSEPQPLAGYLYASIDTDSNGAPLDRFKYAGLCAYPAEPGKTGDLMICILADPRHFRAQNIGGFGAVSHGEEWTFYKAEYVDIGEPLRRWPSDKMLREEFQAVRKRTPEEGLREARDLADSVPKR